MILGATCFSGIGAPECAASWIDWRWSAEIEPFPAAVHAHRFPGSVNLGDVLAPGFLARAEPVDILVPTAYRVTGNDGAYETPDHVGALGTNTDRSAHSIVAASTVRRLMPIECERLQGFPDGWTDILYRGKPAADGPRYKAIGNSMAVPVLVWLLDRIRTQMETGRC